MRIIYSQKHLNTHICLDRWWTNIFYRDRSKERNIYIYKYVDDRYTHIYMCACV